MVIIPNLLSGTLLNESFMYSNTSFDLRSPKANGFTTSINSYPFVESKCEKSTTAIVTGFPEGDKVDIYIFC